MLKFINQQSYGHRVVGIVIWRFFLSVDYGYVEYATSDEKSFRFGIELSYNNNNEEVV